MAAKFCSEYGYQFTELGLIGCLTSYERTRMHKSPYDSIWVEPTRICYQCYCNDGGPIIKYTLIDDNHKSTPVIKLRLM
jgi:hypothetical protein